MWINRARYNELYDASEAIIEPLSKFIDMKDGAPGFLLARLTDLRNAVRNMKPTRRANDGAALGGKYRSVIIVSDKPLTPAQVSRLRDSYTKEKAMDVKHISKATALLKDLAQVRTDIELIKAPPSPEIVGAGGGDSVRVGNIELAAAIRTLVLMDRNQQVHRLVAELASLGIRVTEAAEMNGATTNRRERAEAFDLTQREHFTGFK